MTDIRRSQAAINDRRRPSATAAMSSATFDGAVGRLEVDGVDVARIQQAVERTSTQQPAGRELFRDRLLPVAIIRPFVAFTLHQRIVAEPEVDAVMPRTAGSREVPHAWHCVGRSLRSGRRSTTAGTDLVPVVEWRQTQRASPRRQFQWTPRCQRPSVSVFEPAWQTVEDRLRLRE